MYDFARQFPCTSDTESLTPRDAAALSVALSLIGDGIRNDMESDSNRPIDLQNENEWSQLSRFPRLTWRMSASWRTGLSRAADDLLHDLEVGSLPRPRCPAEEAVLYLAIEDAPGMEELVSTEIKALPRSEHDGQSDGMYDLLFQDTDIKTVFEGGRFDGLEDPTDEVNQALGMGDYRPQAWFVWFDNVTPRRARSPAID